MKYNYIKTGKCKNCKEDNQELIAVRRKGKKEYWCDACLDGYLIALEEKKLLTVSRG